MTPAPLTGDSSVGAVIAEFERVTVPDRDVRAALSHIAAELGTRPIRAVRTRHVTALLEGLRRAGLSARREAAVEDALHDLFAFALARRLIAVDPLAATADPPRAPSTPTGAMLALGVRVAFWTAWTITLGFLVMLAFLLVELG